MPLFEDEAEMYLQWATEAAAKVRKQHSGQGVKEWHPHALVFITYEDPHSHDLLGWQASRIADWTDRTESWTVVAREEEGFLPRVCRNMSERVQALSHWRVRLEETAYHWDRRTNDWVQAGRRIV